MPSQPNPSHRTAATAELPRHGSPRARGLRLGRSEGFTLPEVIVVMLIVGILAAIAIPAFLSNAAKATDVQAKELARNAETTAETVALDHGGSYAYITKTELVAEEPTIAIAPSSQHAYLSKATSGPSEYSLTATATNGDELTISRAADGTISRTCHSPTLKTSCSGAENSSW